MSNILSQHQSHKTLRERFPYTSEKILDVLEQLLQFNPFFRPTARELLKHKIFDSIRQPLIEKPAPRKIRMECDDVI